MINALIPILPELILLVGAVMLVVLGAVFKDALTDQINGLALAMIVMAGVATVWIGDNQFGEHWNGFQFDALARYLKLLVLIGGFVVLVLAIDNFKRTQLLKFEYAILVLFAMSGMMLMISASSFLILYLGMELQSLSLYVLAGFDRKSSRSTEAALKYFVLGALSTGLFLFGVSFLYGSVGGTGYAETAKVIGALLENGLGGEGALVPVLGIVFVLSAIAFKVSAVPFHMWTPDVYQGAPTPVTAFFASAPKIAALGVFIRLTHEAFDGGIVAWQQIIVFIAIASMLWGALAAIGQRSIKRLMAYSSIGHMGYALVGLSAGTEDGFVSVVIYATVYLVMTLGVFAIIIALRDRDGELENIDDLAGLARQHPFLSFFLAMMMFSLAGIPPLAGFFSKYLVFKAAVDAGLVPLAVVGVLSTVIAAFYYLRVIKVIYFDEGSASVQKTLPEIRMLVLGAGLFVLLLWLPPIFWTAPGDWLFSHAQYAVTMR